MKHRLWYNAPTEEYMEGLPVGNGRLAAMMLGRPEHLRIALNHEWMWRGENRHREFPDVSAHLPEVREALLQGDFLRGTELANRYFGGDGGNSGRPNHVDPYQPVGDVHISLEAGCISDYVRSLDLDTGLAVTEFTVGSNRITQKLLVSCADDCIFAEVHSVHPCDFTVSLSRKPDPHCRLAHTNEPNSIRMAGAFAGGIAFEAGVRIFTDGRCCTENDRAVIHSACRTLLLIQIGTNAKGNPISDEMKFPAAPDFAEAFARHAARFAELKGDSTLEIDLPDSDLPTDQRIAAFRKGDDPAMPLLYFEYGRYLMASGSSGELPLNLQGKWNEDLQPPWESDYHLDVNLQMCYWFAETLGMRRAADTLFRLIERYIPHGKEMAQLLYGCRGLTFCLQTDVWGRMTPESCGWAVWIGAAPWLAQHVFMHWRYTKDIDFLRDRCWPFLREAARFYEDYLIPHGNELWIVPSQSPENRFEGTGDWPVSIGINSAMDIQLITGLLTNAAETADILGVEPESAAKWRGIVSRLPKLGVDESGRLNEWDQPRVEVEPGHRHLSHLYGLYPGQLFAPGSREWLAAEHSLDSRLNCGGGHTGWSRAWTACAMARLGRAEDAWQHFIALIGDFATISLLDLHPPQIFQIDGNMGGTACVCEMLMQSRRGELHLLPALPKAWPSGRAVNFHAQDELTVSFSWNNSKLTSCSLLSAEDQELTLVSAGKRTRIRLRAGESLTIQ